MIPAINEFSGFGLPPPQDGLHQLLDHKVPFLF